MLVQNVFDLFAPYAPLPGPGAAEDASLEPLLAQASLQLHHQLVSGIIGVEQQPGAIARLDRGTRDVPCLPDYVEQARVAGDGVSMLSGRTATHRQPIDTEQHAPGCVEQINVHLNVQCVHRDKASNAVRGVSVCAVEPEASHREWQ